jgi:ABC-type branched-subunit amino acid transport system ATPase component
VLVDETSMGLSPPLIETIPDIVLDMRKDGLSVPLLEQNAALASDSSGPIEGGGYRVGRESGRR